MLSQISFKLLVFLFFFDWREIVSNGNLSLLCLFISKNQLGQILSVLRVTKELVPILFAHLQIFAHTQVLGKVVTETAQFQGIVLINFITNLISKNFLLSHLMIYHKRPETGHFRLW